MLRATLAHCGFQIFKHSMVLQLILQNSWEQGKFSIRNRKMSTQKTWISKLSNRQLSMGSTATPAQSLSDPIFSQEPQVPAEVKEEVWV